MYENVIVPFDGTVPGRAALAPATDLAWRCGARVVIVNNSEVSDQRSREVLKGRAMSLSGADVDFWVDTDLSLGKAALQAAKHRPAPILCVSARAKPSALDRQRGRVGPVVDEVLLGAACPVLLIGPETDLSRGLPLTEIIVGLDGSPASEAMLPVAAAWARSMKLRLVVGGVVSPKRSDDHQREEHYLQRQTASVQSSAPEARYELVVASEPAAGIVELAATREDAVVAMSTHGRKGSAKAPLGAAAHRVLSRCPRALLVQRPPDLVAD
ncbi:MAG: universal stress protein [Acidimicrobiia bacterium]|nr:universal stress protein [Acidimicrobiia bacterium]